RHLSCFLDFHCRYHFFSARLGSHACCLPSDDCASHFVLAFAKLGQRQRRCLDFFKSLCYFAVVEIGHTAYRRRWTPFILVGHVVKNRLAFHALIRETRHCREPG